MVKNKRMCKCEEPMFKYLLLCCAYFNAPLPDYLYEAYKHTFTDEDRDLFYKHLTGFDFAAHRYNSAVPVHFRNIKHIKNPLLMPPNPRRGSKNCKGRLFFRGRSLCFKNMGYRAKNKEQRSKTGRREKFRV